MTSLKAWEIFLHYFFPSLHTLALSVFFDVHSAAPGIRRGRIAPVKDDKTKKSKCVSQGEATVVAARRDARRFTALLFYSTWRSGNGDGVCHADEQRRIRHSLKQQEILSAPERLLKLNPLRSISRMWKNANWKWKCFDFLFVVTEKTSGECIIYASYYLS